MAESTKKELLLAARAARGLIDEGREDLARVQLGLVADVIRRDETMMKHLKRAFEDAGEAVFVLFKSVIEPEPDLWKLRKRLGLLESEGMVFAADIPAQIKDLEQLLARDPDDLSARGRLGRLLTLAGRRDEAAVHLWAVAEAAPGDPAAWRELTRMYTEAKDIPGEVKVLQRMLELGLDALLDRYRLARLLINQEREGEAIVQLRILIAEAPDEPGPWRRLARVLADIGDQAGELEALERIVQLEGGDAALRSKLARLLAMAGRGGESLEQLRKVAELEPDDASHWRRLARALAAAGDPAEGDAWSRARSLEGRTAGLDFRGEPLSLG